MILDEVNYAVKLNLITVDDVLEVIAAKPDATTLVLTGNHADEKVMQVADLVTEMREIKHPYQKGIRARKGIDF
jgi:cob(I)alamin adenosyltransferase